MRIWKSLGERRGEVKPSRAEFEEELPAGESVRQISRRDFFRFSGVGFAAGLALSCNSKAAEKAIPYLNAQEDITPGVAQWYASTCGGCAAACGVLVRSRDGRPLKLEGNPEHPRSLGGLCAIGQAQTRGLYDSARLKGPRKDGRECDWTALDEDLARRFEEIRRKGGMVRVLAGSLGPVRRAAVQVFLDTFRNGQIVVYDPLSCAAIPAAYERTHGVKLLPNYRFEEADLILGVEADFLGTWIDPVAFTQAYASRRGPDNGRSMSKHVQVESGLSLTGSNADERIRAAPSEGLAFLEQVTSDLGHGTPPHGLSEALKARAGAVAHQLVASRGASLVVCGINDLRAQMLAARLNHILGNEGRSVDLARPIFQRQGDDGALSSLEQEMAQGRVEALVILGANPAYDLPASFTEAMGRVPLRVNLALTEGETALACTHLAPDHHWLEAWQDAEPVLGLKSLGQPLIKPLFHTRDAMESLLHWAGKPQQALEFLRQQWRGHTQGAFEDFWNDALQKGFVQTTTKSPIPAYRGGDLPERASILGDYELLLYPKVGLGDGTHGHNPWLQELPDPITKVTWDNYLALSPATARRLGFAQGDVASFGPGKLPPMELPVVIQPGQDDRTLAVALGYGRTAGGAAGLGVGGNAYSWRTFTNGFLSPAGGPLQIRGTGRRKALAATQDHHSMEGRELVREMALGPYLRDPASARPHEHIGPSLYPELPKGKHRWAMVIDLSKCTGCSGCVVGCQVENNIPVVGRQEVALKREMHWLRIDRYYTGSEDEPGVIHQPVLCQQCDNAPCENVCPVLATVHSEEGLNQQVYNRCVGTRYCANNCPYKVRRFNWWEYPHTDSLERLALNPDVVVRSRGVMEKCSFCVQRLLEAKIKAKNQGRELRDGEAMPACMQSCPARAIVFGDARDPDSRVTAALRDPKRFLLLGELGVAPAVSYLTRIRNVSDGGAHGA